MQIVTMMLIAITATTPPLTPTAIYITLLELFVELDGESDAEVDVTLTLGTSNSTKTNCTYTATKMYIRTVCTTVYSCVRMYVRK